MEQSCLFKEEDVMASQGTEPEFAAFVAIDWADKIHYWSLHAAGSNQIERGEVENTPEAVEVWAAQWSVRFNSRPIAVALEQRRGALVAMLSKYRQLHLYPVHPLTLAKYREVRRGARVTPRMRTCCWSCCVSTAIAYED